MGLYCILLFTLLKTNHFVRFWETPICQITLSACFHHWQLVRPQGIRNKSRRFRQKESVFFEPAVPFLQWHITRSARHVRPSLFNNGPSSVPRPRHLRHPSRKFISVLTTGSRSSFAFLSRLAAPKLLPPWRSPHSAFSRQPHKSNQPTITQPVPITTTQLNQP